MYDNIHIFKDGGNSFGAPSNRRVNLVKEQERGVCGLLSYREVLGLLNPTQHFLQTFDTSTVQEVSAAIRTHSTHFPSTHEQFVLFILVHMFYLTLTKQGAHILFLTPSLRLPADPTSTEDISGFFVGYQDATV